MNFLDKKSEWLVVAFLLLLLFLPNVVVAAMAEELNGFWIKKMGYWAVSLAILFVPAVFLKRKVYFGVEGVFALLVAPIEVASLYLNHTTTRFMMIDTILSSNMGEAMEFLSSVWWIVLVVLLLWGVYFYLTVRYVRNEDFLPARLKKILLFSLPILFILGFGYYFRLARMLLSSEKTTIVDNMVDAKDMMVQTFYKIFPFDVYLATEEVVARRIEVKEWQARVANFSFGIQPKTDDKEEVYVLVIGETARWKNFGINGYSRNTTPCLAKQRNLVSYSHLVTGANLTSHSVPLILTRADALHRNMADQEKSVCEAFAEAGFHTSWLSSQALSSYQERIIATCDSSVLFDKIVSQQPFYDLDLLPAFKSVLALPNKKKFLVVHSMGSHFKYNARYPEDSVVFRPSFDNTMDFLSASPENVECLVNAYDNTIRYTDAFLAALLAQLEARGGEWAFFYVSDHGENLYDDEHNRLLHGSLVVSPYEAHVPFIVVCSDAYREVHPEKVASVAENKDKNLTTSVIFHSLLDMADISSPVVEDSLCITRAGLRSLDSTYILNGNMQPILFRYSQLDSVR